MIDTLRETEGIVLERVPLKVRWNSLRELANDPLQIHLNLFLLKTSSQVHREGTIVFQMIHPSNFSGGHGARHQVLYQVGLFLDFPLAMI